MRKIVESIVYSRQSLGLIDDSISFTRLEFGIPFALVPIVIESCAAPDVPHGR